MRKTSRTSSAHDSPANPEYPGQLANGCCITSDRRLHMSLHGIDATHGQGSRSQRSTVAHAGCRRCIASARPVASAVYPSLQPLCKQEDRHGITDQKTGQQAKPSLLGRHLLEIGYPRWSDGLTRSVAPRAYDCFFFCHAAHVAFRFDLC